MNMDSKRYIEASEAKKVICSMCMEFGFKDCKNCKVGKVVEQATNIYVENLIKRMED